MHATLEDLARAKGVHATYVSRMLRLTLLAPEIVEAILDGRQPAEVQLDDLWRGFRWSGRAKPSALAAGGIRRSEWKPTFARRLDDFALRHKRAITGSDRADAKGG